MNRFFNRLESFLLLAALIGVLSVAVSRVHSFDIFWQLQTGRFMLETGSFIYRDTFSLAADAVRFEHCWLHDIIFYGAFRLLGYGGISILKGMLVGATGVALFAAARLRGSSLTAILLLLPPALLLTRPGWLERPQLWTFLFFAVFLVILERYRVHPDRTIFWLVPIMILWANLHAGSVLAFPVLGAYALGEAGDRLIRLSRLRKRDYGRFLACSALVSGAALLTPYGNMLFKTLLLAPGLGGRATAPAAGSAGGSATGQAMTGAITQIYNMDWRATSFAQEPFFYWTIVLVAVLLVLGWRRLSLKDLLLFGGIAVMGLKLSRHTTFLYLLAGAFLPRYADAAAGTWFGWLAERSRAQAGFRLLIILGAVAGTLYIATPAYRVHGLFQTGLREWHYPIEAAEFVKDNKLPPNLYNTYDWGGYLMWTLYPDYRVFWDGRSDSRDMFALGLDVMRGAPEWQEILDRFQVRTIVSKACTVNIGRRYPILDPLKESPLWALVFADESSLVFVRRDAMSPDWLARHELSKERIDDTILSEAKLLARVDPGRYMAFWEMTRIYLTRKDFEAALPALGNYLARAPNPPPQALQYYQKLREQLKKEMPPPE